MIAELQRRALQEFGEGAEPIDFIRFWVQEGQTLLELANELTDHTHVKVSRSMLQHYIDASPARKKAMAEARVEGAGALVDRAIGIVDDNANEFDRERLNHSKARADIRLKTAAFWDRATYGQAKEATVQINLGSLHLMAHRDREQQRLAAVQPGQIAEAEIEELPAEEESRALPDAEVAPAILRAGD